MKRANHTPTTRGWARWLTRLLDRTGWLGFPDIDGVEMEELVLPTLRGRDR